jgi:drug/metabolite transporter (DMT)-like permease
MATVASVAGAQASGRTLAYAGLTLATVGWTTAFVVGKGVLAEMTPLVVAAWRYAAAAVVLVPFALPRRPDAGLGRAAVPLAVMVLSGGVLYPWLFLLALERTSATNTSLLVAVSPVLTLGLSPLVGERWHRRRTAGMVLALAGAATVITRGELARLVALSLDPGDLLALTAAAVWAAFNLAARDVVGRLAPPFVNCVVYGLGALALLGLSRHEGPLAQLAAATPAALCGLGAMALLSSVLAGQLFLAGVRAVGVGRAVVFIYLVPVLTAFAGVTLLDERLGPAQGLGGAAVLAGVWLTTRDRAEG